MEISCFKRSTSLRGWPRSGAERVVKQLLHFGIVVRDCPFVPSQHRSTDDNGAERSGEWNATPRIQPIPLFDWFGLACFAKKNKNCQLSYSWFQTSQTGVQWYSDTSPFSIPCFCPMSLGRSLHAMPLSKKLVIAVPFRSGRLQIMI